MDRVLTIRHGDLQLISGLMAESEEQVSEMLADMGLIVDDPAGRVPRWQPSDTRFPGVPTVFSRIITGELPGHFVHRDERCAAFLSIAPTPAGAHVGGAHRRGRRLDRRRP